MAWFSYFPVEWQPNLPQEVRDLPKQHPATWQSVLLTELEKLDWIELRVFSLRKEYPRNFALKRGNVTFHCLKTPGGLRAPTLYWIDTLLLAGMLRKIKPDLVHAWGSEFGSGIVATRLPYPALITMQGLLTWMKELFPLNRQQKISAWCEHRALKRARFVTAESSWAMTFLKNRYPHLQLNQVEHAPNPVYHQVARNPVINPCRIVCVSSLLQPKGADVLLKGLHNLQGQLDFQLSWIGWRDPAFEDRLRRELPSSLWQRITFKNNLTPEELALELASATFAAYPTRADNSPNAVKEAVVAGVPVVASRMGGIVDYVIPGKNGLLFPVGDDRACADSIREAVQHPLFAQGRVDPDTLRQMRDYLAPKTMTVKMLDAYKQVLCAPPPASA